MNAIAKPAPDQLAAQAGLKAAYCNLARRIAPILCCDEKEPFAPDMVGISILAPGEKSPSCRHVPPLQDGAAMIVEFAIWWDGDIDHLYELEHVWIALDADNAPIGVAASAHGKLNVMTNVEWRDGHPVLYCEPGKHAHADTIKGILVHREGLTKTCAIPQRGRRVLIQDMFEKELSFVTPYDHFLAGKYLNALGFEPSYAFSNCFELADLPLFSWSELCVQIPQFMRTQLEDLRFEYKGVKAVFVDSGATLINEASQIFDDNVDGLVLSAEPIEGGDKLVAALQEKGYLVALVADGREQSFENVHGAMGFWDLFDARAVSENCGVAKPDQRIFEYAMRKLGLRYDDAAEIVMFGNNLARDIRGANALGMISVWIDGPDRYVKTPTDELENPDYRVELPLELLDVLEQIEADIRTAGHSEVQ